MKPETDRPNIKKGTDDERKHKKIIWIKINLLILLIMTSLSKSLI